MDWGTIITGIDAAIGLLKGVKGAQEIREDLIDAKAALLEARQENIDLGQRVQQLEEAARLRDELTFKNNVYWKGDEGPFCPRCFDSDGAARRMEVSSDDPTWKCLTCDKWVYTPDAPKLPPAQVPNWDPLDN